MDIDATEKIRQRYVEMAGELTEPIVRHYKAEIEKFSHYPEKVAELDRACKQDCYRALQPIVLALAALPPPPLVIPAP